MHMKSGALQESFASNDLKQFSEQKHSLGKKYSRNNPTCSGLQKCFYRHKGQSIIKNIKL